MQDLAAVSGLFAICLYTSTLCVEEMALEDVVVLQATSTMIVYWLGC